MRQGCKSVDFSAKVLRRFCINMVAWVLGWIVKKTKIGLLLSWRGVDRSSHQRGLRLLLLPCSSARGLEDLEQPRRSPLYHSL